MVVAGVWPKKEDVTVTSQRTSARAEVVSLDGETRLINVTLGKFFFFFVEVKRPYGKLLKRSETGTR